MENIPLHPEDTSRHLPSPIQRVAIAGLCAGVALLATACTSHETVPDAHAISTQATSGQTNLLAGQFSYMPGTSPIKAGNYHNGLTITGLDRRIIEQDGSGAQPNPPVNEYGTYLTKIKGNFAVSATMSDVDGASLQLYSKPPMIMDEFRVEPASVRMTIEKNTIQVKRWDGKDTNDLSNQKPTASYSFGFKPAKTLNVTLSKEGSTLDVAVNGANVGALPEAGTFSAGTIWFGADATLGKPWQLRALTAKSTQKGGSLTAVDASTQKIAKLSPPGLQPTSKKIIGSAASLWPLNNVPNYASIMFGGNLGQITVENALKWQSVEPQPGVYSFQEGDALVNLAQRNKILVNGHAAGAFGEELPKWVTSMPYKTAAQKAKVRQVLVNHITTVLHHYGNKVASWDIVNEPLADYDTFDNSTSDGIYRKNFWEKALGKDYIADAFIAAHKAAPKAALYLNDYGMEGSGDDNDRWNAMLGIAKSLKSKHIPITGIGFEAHVYDITTDKIDAPSLTSRMKQAATDGLKVRISEQDVDDSAGQSAQAKEFASTAQVCNTAPNCVSYSTWGQEDGTDYFQDQDDSNKWYLEHGHDLPYGDNGKATIAVAALRKALQR